VRKMRAMLHMVDIQKYTRSTKFLACLCYDVMVCKCANAKEILLGISLAPAVTVRQPHAFSCVRTLRESLNHRDILSKLSQAKS
jgi:hypothetical protein